MTPSLRRTLLFAAKLAVTAALLAWVMARVDLAALAARLRAAHPGWWLAAAAVSATNISVGALRWRLVLRALGRDLPALRALRLFWASLFFNTFVPSGVVGDALRGAWTARTVDPAQSFASVLLDRFTALVALALVALAGVCLPVARDLPASQTIFIAGLLVAVGGGLVLAFPGPLAQALSAVGGARLRKALATVAHTRMSVAPRLAALALGMFLHLLVVVSAACLARAAAVQVPLGVLVALLPAVLLVAYVPVSISGIGVRDLALVELLGQAAVPPSDALALSLLMLTVNLAVSLVGGLVYLATGRSR